ncbi:MAG: hypothetical protein LBR30_00785 [Clostridioides sp.]|nr:hypothetical protein [Clostridioides sp.]
MESKRIKQIIAMFVLSLKISFKQPDELLKTQTGKIQRNVSGVVANLSFFVGIVLLCVAYKFGIYNLNLENPVNTVVSAWIIIVVCGFQGQIFCSKEWEVLQEN